MKYFLCDSEVQYSMRSKNNIIYLFASKLGQWVSSYKGKVAAKITNSGNGYVVDFHGGKTIELDYSQSVELMLLLKEAEKHVKFDVLKVVKE